MKRLQIIVVTVIIIITSVSFSYTDASGEKLVIDTDAGADDATAILLVLTAWAHHDSNFEVVAITCTYGNTAVQNVEQNVLKTLTIANATYIPVYSGAEKPLTNNFTSDDYFGNDGFGDFVMDEKVTAKVDESHHAAIALVNLAKEYPKQLNVLVLGPLTNVALAISLDSNFSNNVKKFYIMGGSVAGIGNWAPGIEYNFAADPKWRTNVLGNLDSKIMRFLNQAEKKSMTVGSIWQPADAMTAAVMIWPELINEKVVVNVSPVMDGQAKGALLVDYDNITDKPKNAEIVQKLDVELFMNKIIHYFS